MAEKKINNDVEAVEVTDIASKNDGVNLIDLLLNKEKSDFLEKKEEIEISSLSELLGIPVIVEMRRMTLSQEAEMEDYGYKMKFVENGKNAKDSKLQLAENTKKRKLMTIVYSIFYNGEKFFANKSLMAKFGAGTPADLVLILLTPDEIDMIYGAYDDMVNGVTDVEEIKN
ncbi:phage tail assembly chaperone [Peptostreptococcus equinus]|uniref:Phage XkdN-like tail assembly chaperone protein, TAC n=1 Tax=Peptostreptococcus equinus TaxID=3003601 RepID=A0ABY7JQZ0_9FIRM|nr:hypothetical protein [Peptostreptococcus sp. CBA3647]WAW15291.1 hypothetical protein O0R46_02230 [Peptostreptococcus sp. CBA3647]